MSEFNRYVPPAEVPPPDKEATSLSNVSLQFLFGIHSVTTDKEFNAVRKQIEDKGLKFFRRNFNNIYFLEDSSGTINSSADEINNLAKKYKSLSKGYFINAGINENEAQTIIRHLDGGRLKRIVEDYRNEFEGDEGILFRFAELSAIDRFIRKGYQIQIKGEKKSTIRDKSTLIFDGLYNPQSAVVNLKLEPIAEKSKEAEISELIEISREHAKLTRGVNRDLAHQINDIINQNPTRTRLMSFMGVAHAGLVDHLPQNIKKEVQTEDLTDGHQLDTGIRLFLGVLNNDLSDSEIREQLQNNK